MSVPIVLLREGTQSKQGRGQILSNIGACCAVADNIRTTLGPRGLDKLLVDRKGQTIISNDGATILKQLDIVFPAAMVMCDIAKSQDAEVGDGTTSVVVLAAEFLKAAKPFVEEGVSSQVIIKAFNAASQEAIKKLHELAIKITGSSESREMLIRCAATTLSSKLLKQERHHFASMVVDAVEHLDVDLPLNMIGMKKVSGGSIKDSRLVKGVAFKKAFSYAGFEMQPKHYKEPSIALLNIELELKAERDNAELRIGSVADYQEVVNAEWTILYNKLEKIHESGAKIVLSKLPIGDVATQWFADRDMFCAGRIQDDDLNRVVATCGGSILTTVTQIDKFVLGSCSEFYEQRVGGERYNFFIDDSKAKSSTMILRGGSEQFIAETERSLHDAIMIVRRAKKNDSIVAGGDAIEMEISKHLHGLANQRELKEDQFFWKAYAEAFEIIPRQLSPGTTDNSLMEKPFTQREKHPMQDNSGSATKQIFVMSLTGQTITLSVRNSDSVHFLKRAIEDKLGIPASEQRLTYGAKELSRGTLEGVSEGSTLHLNMRLRGGDGGVLVWVVTVCLIIVVIGGIITTATEIDYLIVLLVVAFVGLFGTLAGALCGCCTQRRGNQLAAGRDAEQGRHNLRMEELTEDHNRASETIATAAATLPYLRPVEQRTLCKALIRKSLSAERGGRSAGPRSSSTSRGRRRRSTPRRRRHNTGQPLLNANDPAAQPLLEANDPLCAPSSSRAGQN